MSHSAEAVTLHPAAGATKTIVAFASGLRYADSTTRSAITRGDTCSTPSV